MFQNTSTMSLLFYAIFVAIAFAGLIYVFRAVKRGVDPAKLDRVIELFKWTVVSVAIATVGLVVGDHFKERDQDVEELNYFHTYVEDVKKTEGVNERLRLVTYLSTVAPAGPLKEAWLSYRDTVYKEYTELKLVEKALKPLEAKDTTASLTLTADEQHRLDSLKEKRDELNKPIGASLPVSPDEFRVIVGTDITLESAQFELEKAKLINPSAEIIQQDGKFVTVIETPSQWAAKDILKEARQDINPGAFMIRKESFKE